LEAALSLAFLAAGAALYFGWRPGSPLPAGGPELSLVFASIVLMQLVNAFECRSTSQSIFGMPFLSNPLLPASVAAALLLLMAFVYLPVFQHMLGQTALSARQWLLIGVAPVLFLGAEELRKAIARHRVRLPGRHQLVLRTP
jgi:magnesium-transporting ATPase (P-type)